MLVANRYEELGIMISALLATFCATVVVEFAIIYLLLGRPYEAKGWLFLRVLLIHLISYPLAQAGFFFLFPPDSHVPFPVVLRLCVIEALVVALEYLLLKRVFDAMHRIGRLRYPVNHWRVLKISFAANMVTFVFAIIGWVLYGDLIRILLLHTLPF